MAASPSEFLQWFQAGIVTLSLSDNQGKENKPSKDPSSLGSPGPYEDDSELL